MPQPQKPEKLVIDSIKWNSLSQEFEISLSATFVDTSVEEEHTVATKVKVGTAAKLRGDSRVAKLDPSAGGAGPHRLVPQHLGWDRDGGTFVGTVDVVVAGELKDSRGNVVGTGDTHTEAGVKITAPV